MRKLGFGWNVNLALAGYFLISFAYLGLYTLVGNLYLLRLGYDVTFVGRVNAAFLLVFCLASFAAGFLAGRWGLRRSMLIGASLSIFFYVVFACAEILPAAYRATVLLACTVPGGLGGALYMACVNPCLMETGSSRRTAALSAGAMANLVGYSLGNLAGGLLTGLSARLMRVAESSPAPYRLGLVVAVVVQVGCVACVLLMRPAPAAGGTSGESGEPRTTAPVRAPVSLLVVTVVAGVLLTVFGASLTTFFSLHLDQTFHVPTQSIGAMLAVARGIPALAFVLAPWVAKRFGAYRTAVLATAASTLAATAVGLASHWFAAAAGYTLMSFLSSLGSPASSLLYQEAVAAPARPVVAGVSNAAYGLGSAAIAFVGGYVISWVGYGRFFASGLVVQIVGLAVFAVYFGLRERRRATPAAAEAPTPVR